MPSVIKCVASLAAVAFMVQPSTAGFVAPKAAGGISSLAGWLRNIGKIHGGPIQPLNISGHDENLGDIKSFSDGGARLPVPNQLAWQICRGE